MTKPVALGLLVALALAFSGNEADAGGRGLFNRGGVFNNWCPPAVGSTPYSSAYSTGQYVPAPVGTVPSGEYRSYSHQPGAAVAPPAAYGAPVYYPAYKSGLPSGRNSYLDAVHKMRGRYPY